MLQKGPDSYPVYYQWKCSTSGNSENENYILIHIYICTVITWIQMLIKPNYNCCKRCLEHTKIHAVHARTCSVVDMKVVHPLVYQKPPATKLNLHMVPARYRSTNMPRANPYTDEEQEGREWSRDKKKLLRNSCILSSLHVVEVQLQQWELTMDAVCFLPWCCVLIHFHLLNYEIIFIPQRVLFSAECIKISV